MEPSTIYTREVTSQTILILPEIFYNFTKLKIKNMKIIAIDQVEKKKVQMEGAAGAWKQLPLGNIDGTPVILTGYSHWSRVEIRLITVILMSI